MTAMQKTVPALELEPLRAAVARAVLEDETAVVNRLIERVRSDVTEEGKIEPLARRLVEAIRKGRRPEGGLDAFLQEYALSTEEGVVLMCLAEALLRVPDGGTADRLIKDKITSGDWEKHLGRSSSTFVNASTWGLMLTGRVSKLSGDTPSESANVLRRLVKRSGEPVIRQAMLYAMRIMGQQFVLGRTIQEAMRRAKGDYAQGLRFSFDMLGEAARTMADADRYYDSYKNAIEVIGAAAQGAPDDIHARNSISVKLSALHPRYEEFKRERVFAELTPRLEELTRLARSHGIGLTMDAEEADRLEISLDVFEQVARSETVKGWNGFGLAIQAYQKRALPVIDWLRALAHDVNMRLPVRLVKGAYWDTEIKLHQTLGVEGYPVFTRKAATDTSYLACARALLADGEAFYPQFASHNAHTVAAISVFGGDDAQFEYQRLHGMGEPLGDEILDGALGRAYPLRIYAPVGSHEDLLAYLVRRLLENGANSSFVNRLADDDAPIDEIIADPVEEMAKLEAKPHPRIVPPRNLFPGRKNAKGLLLSEKMVYQPLLAEVDRLTQNPFTAGPIVNGRLMATGERVPVTDPSDRRRIVGHVYEASPDSIEQALRAASAHGEAWDRQGGETRALILEKAADLYEENLSLLIALCVREAGKTVANALADVREAIDFLRYYAVQARQQFSMPTVLPGPTGERNELTLHGRGVFLCISPWNFPIAIFTGQMAAALAAGNAVIAKPAEQTPLIATQAVQLLHKAGVPGEVLHLLPGDGATVGGALVKDQRISGVAFTGSTETAKLINRTLAERDGPIVPLIAETGGQNVMIVDSTALPEQVVRDVVSSAFDSAGQRCSALRILAVQDDVADKIITMLTGAMAELKVGDPSTLSTDIGPVIDEDARAMLQSHAERMHNEARTLFEVPLGPETEHGTFFAPRAVEIRSMDALGREVFGPFLHVVRYKAAKLEELCQSINGLGYGLTLGLHSRIEETAQIVRDTVRVGNFYVNRNQIGAVVEAQPFGGEALSGTGPKAGGPHYLARFAVERVASIDTTASGGNAALMSMGDGGEAA